MRNRRYLGVSAAASHAVHGVAIVLLFTGRGSLPELGTLVAGGIAYLFLAAMVATSFDRSAHWLGARRWRRLHVSGLYWVWAVLAGTYAGPVLELGPAGAIAQTLALALLIVALALRLWSRRRTGQASRDGVAG